MSKALGCEFCGKILKLTVILGGHMKTLRLANLLFIYKALGCDFCGTNIQINNQFRKTYENCSFG